MQAAQLGRLILRDERTQRRMPDDISTEHAKRSVLREELDPAVEIAAVGAMAVFREGEADFLFSGHGVTHAGSAEYPAGDANSTSQTATRGNWW